jgi:LysM repeat protein
MGMVAVVTVIGMTSCGDNTADGQTGTTAVQLTATNYVTVPPAASTLAPPATTAGPQPEQEYIIEQGDLPVTIAKKFNVPFQELMDLNGWVLEGQMAIGFPPVGTPIRIPAGGTLPGETLPPTTAAPAGAATSLPTVTQPVFTAAPTTTIDPKCIGEEYTIASGDFPLRVAERFGTTVQQLNAINAGTRGYQSFSVGTVIKIPSQAEGC